MPDQPDEDDEPMPRLPAGAQIHHEQPADIPAEWAWFRTPKEVET